MSIQILMSTYNGEKYIRTQLDSILSQTYQDFHVFVRDDGSTDKTLSILEEYTSKDERVIWFQGKNMGAALSFFELINCADLEMDYFAFADQDDFWLPDKLERAVAVLDNVNEKGLEYLEKDKKLLFCGSGASERPLLYCGAKELVDEGLQPLDNAVSIIVKKLSFGNALVQNICTGCTCVLNREFIKLLREYTPQNLIMHDWWFYLIGSSMGTVVYDQVSMIRYRQHGRNTSGAMVSKWELAKYRLRQLVCKRGDIYRQVEEFQSHFKKNLNRKDVVLAKLVCGSSKSIFERIKLVFNSNIYRQKTEDNFVFKLIVILGKL